MVEPKVMVVYYGGRDGGDVVWKRLIVEGEDEVT